MLLVVSLVLILEFLTPAAPLRQVYGYRPSALLSFDEDVLRRERDDFARGRASGVCYQDHDACMCTCNMFSIGKRESERMRRTEPA